MTHHAAVGPPQSELNTPLPMPPFTNNFEPPTTEVVAYEPHSGGPGNDITIEFRCSHSLELTFAPPPSIFFAGHQLVSHLWPLRPSERCFNYQITATIPVLATEASPMHMSLSLGIFDVMQGSMWSIIVGGFEYWRPTTEHQNYVPLQLDAGKRRASSASALPNQSSVKKGAPRTFAGSPATPPYMCSPSTPWQFQQIYTNPNVPTPTYQQKAEGGPSHGLLYASPSDAYNDGERSALTAFADSTTPLMGRSYAYGPIGMTKVRSPTADTPVRNIRTSMLRQRFAREHPRHSFLRPQVSAPQFNSHNIPGITLKIEGDLETVLQDWTLDEQESRRRIVAFDRRQLGDIITISFRIVSGAEWRSTNISVSCIWWEDKQIAYITSVDLIKLLGHIMAQDFQLPEKNRIRRNLEGFKPLTIGKAKRDKTSLPKDVERYFGVIMRLDHPKPRTIEKDVKVFPWSSLSLALKKVVEKYTPCYISRNGSLTPAHSSCRSFRGSPLRSMTKALTSEDQLPPARSVAHGAGVVSPSVSPYSVIGTSRVGMTLPENDTLYSPLYPEQPAWQASLSDHSTFHLGRGYSDAYRFPPSITSETTAAASPESPSRGRGRSRAASRQD